MANDNKVLQGFYRATAWVKANPIKAVAFVAITIAVLVLVF